MFINKCRAMCLHFPVITLCFIALSQYKQFPFSLKRVGFLIHLIFSVSNNDANLEILPEKHPITFLTKLSIFLY